MMTALALLAPLIGLAVVLMLQMLEAQVLGGPTDSPRPPTPIPTPTPFR